MTDQWTDKLSDYLDGELNAADSEALEAHLLECAECGHTLRQLRGVVARAGQVVDREPPRDLWPAIAARLAEVPQLDLVTSEGSTSRGKRRFSFSIPQLAAASVAIMLMSAGTMYMLVQRGDEAAVAAVQQPAAQPVPAGSLSVRAVTRNYDDAVQELETVLERNRHQLDSSTVRVLEQNLAIIDRAITEARAALGQEPANPYLSRYLDQAMQKKVQLLQRATSVMRAQT
jgi:anti-sigma factor RsiW